LYPLKREGDAACCMYSEVQFACWKTFQLPYMGFVFTQVVVCVIASQQVCWQILVTGNSVTHTVTVRGCAGLQYGQAVGWLSSAAIHVSMHFSFVRRHVLP
jgi:hypothetical protein